MSQVYISLAVQMPYVRIVNITLRSIVGN